jgi:hypothetical protein
MSESIQRRAELKLERGPMGPTLVAGLPLSGDRLEVSKADFLHVAEASYDLISRLTGCPCLSGRIRFLAEDVFSHAIPVDLGGRSGGH